MTQPIAQVFDAQLYGGGRCPNCGMWGKQHHAPRCFLRPPWYVVLWARFASWRRRERVARAVRDHESKRSLQAEAQKDKDRE